MTVWDTHPEIWENDYRPEAKHRGHFWEIQQTLKDGKRLSAYVIVYVNGEIHLDKAMGFASRYEPAVRESVIEWLAEWEFISRRKVGAEDWEWFATESLDPEYGVE